MADIVILTHAHDVFLRRTYLLESLFSYWRQAGHKVGIVRGTRHLVSLIGAPCGKLDTPGIRGGHRGRQIIGKFAGVRFGQGEIAAGD